MARGQNGRYTGIGGQYFRSRLLNPVTVDCGHTLIAGLHRLEAAKLLGWTEIECTVSGLEGLQVELAEIDENFVRADLSPVDYGNLLLRRKEIYETLHPETRNGGDCRSEKIRSAKCASDSAKSFVDDTAEKLGVAPSTVRRQRQKALLRMLKSQNRRFEALPAITGTAGPFFASRSRVQ